MKLHYFSGSCALASNISLGEAGLKFELGLWPQLQRRIERVGERPHVIEALKTGGLLK